MNDRDQYLQSQLPAILQPGEQVMHVAYLRRQPGLIMQMLLVGGLLLMLMTKAYYAVLTNRRLILIRTKMSFWSGRPQMLNLGVESFDVTAMKDCTTSGFANNRSMTFHFHDGTKQTLRISPWFESVTGNKAFFNTVPGLIKSGQLAQGGGGQAPQMGQGQGQMQQPMAQMQAPQQAPQLAQGQGYGAPPPQQQQQQGPGGPPPGQQVMVLWTDGNRYPGTVVQAQNGQVLVAMQNGAQQWVPQQNVS